MLESSFDLLMTLGAPGYIFGKGPIPGLKHVIFSEKIVRSSYMCSGPSEKVQNKANVILVIRSGEALTYCEPSEDMMVNPCQLIHQ